MNYHSQMPAPPDGRADAQWAARVMISVVGRLLSRPDVLTRGQWEIPPVRRLTVFIEGGDGVGHITGCELYGADSDQPLESDDAELLLETRIPVAEGREPVAIGRLLDGAVLTLLDIRRTGWSDGEGSGGEAEILFAEQPRPRLELATLPGPVAGVLPNSGSHCSFQHVTNPEP